MNLKQIEAILYVARHGTFKKAAEALYFDSSGDDYVTPESIQYRVKQLEAEVGVSLYRKRQGSSRVTLTREGQLFLSEAFDVYQRMRGWRGMFLDSDQALLTVAATQAVIIHHLTPAILAFRERNPSTRLRTVQAYAPFAEDMVAQGRAHLGFSLRSPERGGLEFLPWRRSAMVLLAPRDHALARQPSVTLAEIAEHPLVLLEREIRGDRELVDEAFRRAGLRNYDVAIEASTTEIIATFVEEGAGVSIVAEASIIHQPRKLVAVPISDTIGKSEIGLLLREGQYLPPRTREFLTLLDPRFDKWLDERNARIEAADPELSQLGTPPPQRPVGKEATR